MFSRREMMARLGAVRWCHCGAELPFDGEETECGQCKHQSWLARHDERMNKHDREMAIITTRRPSSGDYREACAAMEDDVAATLGAWQMGNGVLGPKY